MQPFQAALKVGLLVIYFYSPAATLAFEPSSLIGNTIYWHRINGAEKRFGLPQDAESMFSQMISDRRPLTMNGYRVGGYSLLLFTEIVRHEPRAEYIHSVLNVTGIPLITVCDDNGYHDDSLVAALTKKEYRDTTDRGGFPIVRQPSRVYKFDRNSLTIVRHYSRNIVCTGIVENIKPPHFRRK